MEPNPLIRSVAAERVKKELKDVKVKKKVGEKIVGIRTVRQLSREEL